MNSSRIVASSRLSSPLHPSSGWLSRPFSILYTIPSLLNILHTPPMNITSSIEHINCQVGCRVHSRYYIILYLSAEYTPPMNITKTIEHDKRQVGCRVHSRYYILSAEYSAHEHHLIDQHVINILGKPSVWVQSIHNIRHQQSSLLFVASYGVSLT
jgi:hypothetical protein